MLKPSTGNAICLNFNSSDSHLCILRSSVFCGHAAVGAFTRRLQSEHSRFCNTATAHRSLVVSMQFGQIGRKHLDDLSISSDYCAHFATNECIEYLCIINNNKLEHYINLHTQSNPNRMMRLFDSMSGSEFAHK